MTTNKIIPAAGIIVKRNGKIVETRVLADRAALGIVWGKIPLFR